MRKKEERKKNPPACFHVAFSAPASGGDLLGLMLKTKQNRIKPKPARPLAAGPLGAGKAQGR